MYTTENSEVGDQSIWRLVQNLFYFPNQLDIFLKLHRGKLDLASLDIKEIRKVLHVINLMLKGKLMNVIEAKSSFPCNNSREQQHISYCLKTTNSHYYVQSTTGGRYCNRCPLEEIKQPKSGGELPTEISCSLKASDVAVEEEKNHSE